MTANTQRPLRQLNQKLVVIGGSAGGIAAMIELLSGLPNDFPAPIVFVTHMKGGRASLLDKALGLTTPLEVLPAEDGAELRAGKVYVTIPDHHIEIADGFIRVSQEPADARFRPSIDIAFRSAANIYGKNLIAVVLSGMLDDGIQALLDVDDAGGTTLVQDPREADFPSMPAQAIMRDHPNFIMSLANISTKLVELVRAG